VNDTQITFCGSCYFVYAREKHRCPHCGWGTLTPSEIKDVRQTLGMTQQGFAKALGYSGSRAVRWWESGRIKVPMRVTVAVQHLLRERDADKPAGGDTQ
jgi:DNA-binding transcriptional regulator YiaG